MSQTIVLLTLLAAEPADLWPAFRGTGDSIATVSDLPLTWDDKKNLAWSAELPGYGQSSPIVCDRRVFVTSVKGDHKETLIVACIHAESSRLLWQKEFPASQQVKVSGYVSRGAPTPAVDAERLYAFFESGDLIALNHEGKELWKRSLTEDYGEFQGNHGLGSSPALTDDLVVLLVDHAGPSYLLALDKATGENVWKVDRSPRVSWSSPTVVPPEPGNEQEGPQIVTSSNGIVEAYSVRDGKRLWWIEGLEGNTVASPSVAGNLVVVGSSQVGSNLAIRRGGQGDVSASHIAWRAREATSSFGSPLVYCGRAWFVNRAGVAYCLDLKTGESLWTERLPDSCWASPVGHADRVYFFGKEGTTLVVRAGATFEKLTENRLPTDSRVYGVAVLDGAFLIRTGTKLLRVGLPAADGPTHESDASVN